MANPNLDKEQIDQIRKTIDLLNQLNMESETADGCIDICVEHLNALIADEPRLMMTIYVDNHEDADRARGMLSFIKHGISAGEEYDPITSLDWDQDWEEVKDESGS